MKALVFGVDPETVEVPAGATELQVALARTPMRLMDVEDPGFLLPDWVVCTPRLTGICGSDSKQVFMDWGEVDIDNPMVDFASFPHILGHEVVADVTALGPEAEGLEIGQRVVLNPWLSCAPRGVSPLCPACAVGDLSLCWNFRAPPIAPGIHSGTSKDASGGYATAMPAHDTMLFPVPDQVPDELAVFADPFAVSLHAVTRHAPPSGGRVLVYGAGALGSCAITILRALYPDVEVGVVARFASQANLASKLGAARVFDHEPLTALIEQIADWSGGV
ncbi:MAG: medium chain dehydrogenase/reductase family protein, partial [Actinobacteria bacterium]|nr:medium chain dehydrogenase/reductase family protein [Actinomycetota bacterium]